MFDLVFARGIEKGCIRFFSWLLWHRGLVETNETVTYRAGGHPRNLLAPAELRVNAQTCVIEARDAYKIDVQSVLQMDESPRQFKSCG